MQKVNFAYVLRYIYLYVEFCTLFIRDICLKGLSGGGGVGMRLFVQGVIVWRFMSRGIFVGGGGTVCRDTRYNSLKS